MKIYRIRVLTFVLFVLVSATFTKAQPKVSIKPLSYDFGAIIQDSIVSTKFLITNEGSELLKITSVKSSCGCTAVVVGKNELMPFESTDLNVSFNSKGKLGKQVRTVTVETNDPKNSSIKIPFTGNVVEKNIKYEKSK